MINIKRLPTEIIRKGFVNRLLVRSEEWAIYERFFEGVLLCYEIIKVRRRGGTSYQPEVFEYYPSDEEFGYYGWTFKELRPAIKKYIELLNSSKNSSKEHKNKNKKIKK